MHFADIFVYNTGDAHNIKGHKHYSNHFIQVNIIKLKESHPKSILHEHIHTHGP